MSDHPGESASEGYVDDAIATEKADAASEAENLARKIEQRAVAKAHAIRDETVGLATDMRDIARGFGDLRAYGRRNRKLIWVTIASVVLDICLSAVIGVGYFRVNDAATQAKAAAAANVLLRESQRLACVTSNSDKERQIALWDYFFHLTPVEPPAGTPTTTTTPEAKQRLDDAKAFIARTFAPTDCDHLP